MGLPCGRSHPLAATQIFDPRRPFALEGHAAQRRLGPNVEVGAAADRLQKGLRGAGAPSVADRRLMRADAFLRTAVGIRIEGQTDLLAGAHDGVAERALLLDIGDIERTADTMNVALAAAVVLRLLEVRQYVLIGPSGAPHLRPDVVVLALAAHIDHAVD